jgi:hypothetical protein
MIEAEERRRREQMREDIRGAISDVVHEASETNAGRIAEALVEPMIKLQASATREALRPLIDGTASLKAEATHASSRQRITVILASAALLLLMAILCLLLAPRLIVEAPPQLVGGMAPPSPPAPAEAVSATNEWQQEIERLQAEAVRLSRQTQQLQQDAAQKIAEMETLGSSLTAMQQMNAAAREELGNLQQLQLAYQFRLLPGEDGRVFVRVPDGATPVQFEGRRYIEVQ